MTLAGETLLSVLRHLVTRIFGLNIAWKNTGEDHVALTWGPKKAAGLPLSIPEYAHSTESTTEPVGPNHSRLSVRSVGHSRSRTGATR